MAELGDFLLQTKSDGVEPNIDINMLDYTYVDGCSDVKILRGILRKLKSGDEGHYPHLEKHVENKIMGLIPKKERQKIERLRQQASPDEIAEAVQELREWQTSISEQDTSLRSREFLESKGQARETLGAGVAGPGPLRELPPVRGMGGKGALPPGKKTGFSETRNEDSSDDKKERISGYDFRAWERFDVEAACQELDQEEDKEAKRKEIERKRVEEAELRRQHHRRQEMEKLRESMDLGSLSDMQKSFLAKREKDKGNECFRAGEAEDALLYYSRSIAYDDSSAVVYANRAMACIRLEKLVLAEDDCTAALELDPMYAKAWSRRAMVRHKRAKYKEAIEDFEKAMEVSPNASKEIIPLLEKSREKYMESYGEQADASIAQAASKGKKTRRGGKKKKKKSNKTSQGAGLPTFFAIPIEEGPFVEEQGAKKLLLSEDAKYITPFQFAETCEIGNATSPNTDEEQVEDGDKDGQITEPTEKGAQDENGHSSKPEESSKNSSIFKKIAIVEESSSDEGEENGPEDIGDARNVDIPNKKTAPNEKQDGNAHLHLNGAQTSTNVNAFKKIAIVEESSDEEEGSSTTNGNAVMDSTESKKILITEDSSSDEHEENQSDQTRFKATIEDEISQPEEELAGTILNEEEAPAAEEVELTAWDIEEMKRKGVEFCQKHGDYEKAQEIFSKALRASQEVEVDPSLETALRLNLSYCFLSLGKHSEVVHLCSEVLAMDPENVKALLRRAVSLEALGKFLGAFQDYLSVYLTDPSLTEAKDGVKRLYDSAKADEQCIPSIEEIFKDETAANKEKELKSDELKQEGNKMMQKGNFQEAVILYTQSLRAYPDNLASLNNRSQAYLKLKKYKLAAEDASKVLEKEPENVKALFRRGQALRLMSPDDQNNLASALQDFTQVMTLDRNNKQAEKQRNETVNQLTHLKAKESSKKYQSARAYSGESDQSTTGSILDAPAKHVAEESSQKKSGFKVSITEESDGDEEEDCGRRKEQSGFKVSIEEDSPSDEKQTSNRKEQSGFKVSIEEDSPSDEEQTSGRKEQSGFKVSIEEDSPSDEEQTSGRKEQSGFKVSIEEDSESDEEQTSNSNQKTAFKVAIEEDSSPDEEGESDRYPFPEEIQSAGNEEELLRLKSLSEAAKKLGTGCFQSGDFQGAIEKYTESLEYDPDNVAALNNRCLTYFRMEQYENSCNDASAVLNKDANNIKALIRRGLSLEELAAQNGDTKLVQKALADYERVLAIDGSNDEARMHIERLNGALSEPSNETVDNEASQLKTQKANGYEDAKDAEMEGTKVQIIEVSDTESDEEGPPRKEIQVKEEITELKETTVPPDLKNPQKTMEKVEQAPASEPVSETPPNHESQDNPEKSEDIKLNGNKLMKKGDFHGAALAYTESLELWSSNLAALNNRCQAYLKLKQYTMALSDASAVLQQDASNQKARFRRSQALYHLGKEEASLSHLKEASSEVDKVLVAEPSSKEAVKLRQQISMWMKQLEQTKKPKDPPKQEEKLPSSQPQKQGGEDDKETMDLPAPPSRDTKSLADLPPSRVRETPPTRSGNSGNSTKQVPEQKPPPKKKSPKVSEHLLKKIRSKVPVKPPRTMYELERECRNLRNDTEAMGKYLLTFKQSTFKKVFKESTNPEVITAILSTLEDYLVSHNPASTCQILNGLSKMANFQMTALLFSQAEKQALEAIFKRLEISDTNEETVQKLRSAYNI